MKKFLEAFDKVFEQDETGAELPGMETDAATETPEVTAEQPEPEVEKLSPESEVLLVRMIKKALVTNIDTNDVDSIASLGDINEKNAKSSLSLLINIMKKYSTDIDIDV